MSLKNVLTEEEVAALKQSVAEDLGLDFGELTENKAKTFWRTVRGQKMQFRGIPDDGKPDELVRGGHDKLRAAMGSTAGVLKGLVNRVKSAKKALSKAGKGIRDTKAKVKRAAKQAGDAIAALAGDDFII